MSHPALIGSLLDRTAYAHPAGVIRLIETHISWVLIAGDFAYKIKKPVNFGFLDFSTLERRQHFCAEEIRLNRRLAPDTYLGVVPVTASGMETEGDVLEWAVKMRAFPADATLDKEMAITPGQIDAIADRLATFHGEVDRAPADSDYGRSETVMGPVRENFRQMRECRPGAAVLALLDELEAWSEREGNALTNHFTTRKAEGFVRECHGDLHLGNIAWVEGQPLIFDCIEFNPRLRFIDILSEIAFLFMDLASRRLEGLAWRLLNRWLERSGDYGGLAGLRFYLVYRAMVRAKVAFIRAGQGDDRGHAEALHYLELAHALMLPHEPMLLLMHGLSGSGKTWVSQQLLETRGAIRLRADVERKRLSGLAAMEDSSGIPGGIYTAAATRRTFQRLRDLTTMLLALGHTVIVDATFLSGALRKTFLELAAAPGIPVRIISVQGDAALLRQRVEARASRKDDASEADPRILEEQIRHQDFLSTNERALTLFVDAASSSLPPELIRALNPDLF